MFWRQIAVAVLLAQACRLISPIAAPSASATEARNSEASSGAIRAKSGYESGYEMQRFMITASNGAPSQAEWRFNVWHRVNAARALPERQTLK